MVLFYPSEDSQKLAGETPCKKLKKQSTGGQCLQHTVSLTRNFNPNFSTFGVYIRILCFVLIDYIKSQLTHTQHSQFFPYFQFFLRISSIIA